LLARLATARESGSAPREAVHILEDTEDFMTEVIGWFSSFILVLTIAKQVHKQWKSGSSEGVSKWLFVGQITASIGFTIYSVLVGNWVFVVTNALLLLSAVIGGLIVLKHRRAERRSARSAEPSRPTRPVHA
jgi:MtN3 and saliva related transmembrane protein